MLPQLYALNVRAIVGYVMHSQPGSIRCPVCGAEAYHYRSVELVLERWPECELVASEDGALFASERLVEELDRAGVTGCYCSDWAATIAFDQQFVELNPGVENRRRELPTYHYLAITGRCDGPWLHDVPGEPCTRCGQMRAKLSACELRGHDVTEGLKRWRKTSKLVYAESWRGQDFFWLPEPGDPIVTERVAEILSRTGNLRRRQIASRNEIRRRTPGWARELEEAGWEQPVCAELGPADWVTRGGPALPGQGTSCQADGHAPSCEAVWSRTTCPGQPGTAPLKRSAGSSSSRSGSDRWLPRVPSRTSAGVAMTGEFYFVTWPGRYPFAVACAPPGYRCDLLKEAEPARDWVPIRFVLRDGAYADYQANDLGWCLCSERLKEVLASHASPEDVLQWLDATVIGPDGEERSYHILHLPRRPDVLDRTKTVFAPGGLVVKPYLNGTMAARHRVFSYLGGTGRLIVHREVRDAVVAARCTGLDFYQAWVA